MLKPFTFEEGGRTYECAVEKARPPREGHWWWFAVSGDGQRYAPFEALPGDTRDSVRLRVVAYYTERLVRLATPYTRGPFDRSGARTPAAAASPAAATPTPTPAPAK
jgi:hypothetical protein